MFSFNDIESYPILEPVEYHRIFKEQIVLLYYNLTRKNNDNLQLNKLSIQFNSLLIQLKQACKKDSSLVTYVEIIYKMIAETRDCFYGKGEHDLSYMLIFIFYKYYPVLATYLIYKFVQPLENGSLGKVGYGSWRDIKYLCQYVLENSSKKEKDTIIEICVELVTLTLKKDMEIVSQLQKDFPDGNINYREHLSSLVKWLPRENKKFDWLNELCVIHWFDTYHPDFFGKVTGYEGYYMALDKAKMLYRKMVVGINRYLDTTEIKLCEKDIEKIVIKNVPQLCMNNNHHLFLNDSLKQRHLFTVFSNKSMAGYQNMKEYLHNKYVAGKEGLYELGRERSINLPNSGKLSYFIKEAYRLIETHTYYTNQDMRIDMLNNQWKQMSEMIGDKKLYSFIPLLDVSFHHDKETLYSGIALALLISEHSSYNHRILVIDQQPLWVNLEKYDTLFSKMVILNKAIRSFHGTTSNFLRGIHLLLDSFIETDSINKLGDMNLVFLHGDQPVEYKKVIDLYLQRFKGGLPCSRFIYWNLSQKYIDSIHNHPNCFYLSGLSPSLLINLYLINNTRGNNADAFQFISSILGKVYYDDIKISRFIL